MDRAQGPTGDFFSQNLRGTLTNSAKSLSDGPRRPAAGGEDPWIGRLCEPAIGQDELSGTRSKEWQCSHEPQETHSSLGSDIITLHPEGARALKVVHGPMAGDGERLLALYIVRVPRAHAQKSLSQRLPAVWGRWEAGIDYCHYRFYRSKAPAHATCLSPKLE